MAQPVLAGLRQCHRCDALDSAALPCPQSIAGRMDLWPLDHGAHESGTLWMDESSHGRVSLQGLRRGARATSAMVQAGSVGVVRGARRGRVFLALRPLQRQAVSRLVRLRAHLLPAGDDCPVGAARRLVRPRMEDHGNSAAQGAKLLGLAASAGCSMLDLHCVQPRLLSGHQSRHRRPHWSESA